jgi:hypothetical protein
MSDRQPRYASSVLGRLDFLLVAEEVDDWLERLRIYIVTERLG